MAVMPKLSRRVKLQILLLDVIVYLASIVVIFHVRIGPLEGEELLSPGLGLILSSLFIVNYIFSTYDVDSIRGRQIIFNTGLALFVHLTAAITVIYLFGVDRMGLYGRGVLFGSAILYFFFSLTYRLAIRSSFKQKADRAHWIILSDEKIESILNKDALYSHMRGQFQVVNFIENQNPHSLSDRRNSGYVVAALGSEIPQNWKSFLLDRKMAGEAVMSWADFVEKVSRKIPVEHIQEDWLVFTSGYSILRLNWLVRTKRIADLNLALLVAVVSSPFIVLTALAVKLDSKGPALYKQKRTGLHGRIFTIYKFRSMRTDAEAAGPQWAKEKDNRVTRVGNFIRKTRLDELPQLWNVIVGDMSFIGPRPERPEFNEQLQSKIPFYNLRHSVRPGLTGWAQILYPYGASEIDAKNKLEYDLYYIKNYSLILDFLILLRTVNIVLFGRGR